MGTIEAGYKEIYLLVLPTIETHLYTAALRVDVSSGYDISPGHVVNGTECELRVSEVRCAVRKKGDIPIEPG